MDYTSDDFVVGTRYETTERIKTCLSGIPNVGGISEERVEQAMLP